MWGAHFAFRSPLPEVPTMCVGKPGIRAFVGASASLRQAGLLRPLSLALVGARYIVPFDHRVAVHNRHGPANMNRISRDAVSLFRFLLSHFHFLLFPLRPFPSERSRLTLDSLFVSKKRESLSTSILPSRHPFPISTFLFLVFPRVALRSELLLSIRHYVRRVEGKSHKVRVFSDYHVLVGTESRVGQPLSDPTILGGLPLAVLVYARVGLPFASLSSYSWFVLAKRGTTLSSSNYSTYK